MTNTNQVIAMKLQTFGRAAICTLAFAALPASAAPTDEFLAEFAKSSTPQFTATTKTGPPGSKAKVIVRKKKNSAQTVFAFTIPRGKIGPRGPQGHQGLRGIQGPPGPAGPLIHTAIVSRSSQQFLPPTNNTMVVDFGSGVALARDGTVDGLKLLTTGTTTSKLAVTATGVDLAMAAPWQNYVVVPAGTLANQTYQVVIPGNNVYTRIIAGDPANKGVHTVIELHRDPTDFYFTYIGTMTVQDAQ